MERLSTQSAGSEIRQNGPFCKEKITYVAGENGNVMPWWGMPIRIIISLLCALETITISVGVLSSVRCQIVLPFLVGWLAGKLGNKVESWHNAGNSENPSITNITSHKSIHIGDNRSILINEFFLPLISVITGLNITLQHEYNHTLNFQVAIKLTKKKAGICFTNPTIIVMIPTLMPSSI